MRELRLLVPIASSRDTPVAMTSLPSALLPRCLTMSMVQTVCRLSCSLPFPHPTRLATLSSWQSTGVKVATPVGNLFGQLIFGWLADVVGRKRMCK